MSASPYVFVFFLDLTVYPFLLKYSMTFRSKSNPFSALLYPLILFLVSLLLPVRFLVLLLPLIHVIRYFFFLQFGFHFPMNCPLLCFLPLLCACLIALPCGVMVLFLVITPPVNIIVVQINLNCFQSKMKLLLLY